MPSLFHNPPVPLNALNEKKPTIVLFAGAFANPSWCFKKIAPYFNKAGYPTVYARVPSLCASIGDEISCARDAETSRNAVLLPLIEGEQKDVIIFAHAYGGVVGGGAAVGLSKKARAAEGKDGGVVGLVYLAGNLVSEGETLFQFLDGIHPDFIKTPNSRPDLAIIRPVMPVLYNDVTPVLSRELIVAALPTAFAAFRTPAPAQAWKEDSFEGRRLYISTLADKCNLTHWQNAWIEKSGVKWIIVRLLSSHCPFISCPELLVDKILEIIDFWT